MNKKTYKIRNIIFIALMVLINAFIIFEASLPGGLSSIHSGIFSDWFGGIINDNVSASQEVIKLESISIKNSAFDPDSDIVIGTTERLDVTLTPANVSDKDIEYKVEPEGIVNLVPSGNSVFVEAIGEVGKTAKITATSNEKTVSYTFNVVERPAPTQFDSRIRYYEMKKNTSQHVDIRLFNLNLLEERQYDQSYLIRYFDPNKLEITSSDENIAYINKGYIVAKNIGSCDVIINKGKPSEYVFPIQVVENDEPVILPMDFDVTLTNDIHVYDLDYVNDHKDEVGGQFNVEFKGTKPSDSNVAYEVLTPLNAVVDHKGVIYGYKKTGTAKVRVTSIANPSLVKEIDVNVSEVKATSCNIVVNGKTDLVVGDNFSINASFEPFNTTNKNLIASVDNPDIAKVSARGRSIAVTALDAGDIVITVKSESNPELSKQFSLNFSKKLAINDDNKNEFASFVRKALGHFLLFLVNGIATTFAFIFIAQKRKDYYQLAKPLVASMGVGFGIAWLSEFIQIFVKRGASISDIMLDFSGFMVALILIMIFFIIYNRVNKGKLKEDHHEED